MLAGCRSVKRILCPSKNAFNKYAEILSAASDQVKDSLFLLAFGPTATVLSYDLAMNDFQAIDIGHLDVDYSWFLAGATRKTKVKGRAVNEVGVNTVGPEKDKFYQKQIIKRISV